MSWCSGDLAAILPLQQNTEWFVRIYDLCPPGSYQVVRPRHSDGAVPDGDRGDRQVAGRRIGIGNQQ